MLMLNILVVDDDPDLLEMVETFLIQAGMNVFGISEVTNLEKIIIDFNPALILMDIYLNGEDGRTVCYKLKTAADTRHMPVILYSAGYIEANSIATSLADAFLSKPFDIDHVIAKINSLIN